jgi:hypothetical protein
VGGTPSRLAAVGGLRLASATGGATLRAARTPMATSLRDIPGASKRSGRRPLGIRPDASRPILFDPREGLGGRRGRRPFGRSGGRRRSPLDVALLLGLVLVVVLLLRGAWTATRVDVESTGLAREDAITFAQASELDVRITVAPASGLASAKLLLDGDPLTKATRTEDGFAWKPGGPLTAGMHELVLEVPRPVLSPSRFTWKFLVDPKAPTIQAPSKIGKHRLDQPVRINGRVDTDAELTANGKAVELDDDGRFTLRYPTPPAGPITLVARDAAGYVVKRELFVPIDRPVVRGVHMTAISWKQRDLRDAVFALIDERKINTVELDLKDESGEVGYDSEVALARDIGAVKKYYDLAEAVKTLHDKGVRVIGRVVVYRDPVLAEAAWERGNRDWVLQKPDGSPQGAYGGFTNMASPAVRQYNLDIAAEAAEIGVDEILWDYIRRPEGDLSQMVFQGMESTTDAVQRQVADFLSRGHAMLRAKEVIQGASLFGVAAGEPTTIGQHVPDVARHVDYIAPMVYPSLFTSQYNVTDPTRNPHAIVVRSLEDFVAKAKGTGVQFTPWLQDFSLGHPYRDLEVAEQIRGARDAGIEGWILWSPRVIYHAGNIAPIEDDEDAKPARRR